MCSERNLRLSEFVGRTRELESFLNIIDTDDKPIIVFSGGLGVGKTSLLARLAQECTRRKLRTLEVTWDELRYYDYLGIMLKIRDGLDADYFKGFTRLVN